MAESLDNAAARAAAFNGLLSALIAGGSTKVGLERYRTYIDDARPEDLVAAVDAAVARNESFEALKPAVSKLINLIYASLSRHRYAAGGGNAFLDSLVEENAGLAALLARGKALNQALNDKASEGRSATDTPTPTGASSPTAATPWSAAEDSAPSSAGSAPTGQGTPAGSGPSAQPAGLARPVAAASLAGAAALDALDAWLVELGAVEAHYRKKENVLFPWFEAHYPQYRCVRLMWEIQDDARRGLKDLSAWLSAWLSASRSAADPTGKADLVRFNALMGRLYFDLNANITREECALFPVMATLMDEASAAALLAESRAYGWAFLDASKAERFAQTPAPAPDAAPNGAATAAFSAASAAFSGRTGALPAEVLGAIFAALPVDMTYVDAENRVRWFSDSPHRIFPRSPAIIGRDVRNCHPGASVGRVLAILEAFKSGAKDKESFWISMGGRFISIEYFALRAPDGRYLGTLEASQDLSEKRALSGEKRLAT